MLPESITPPQKKSSSSRSPWFIFLFGLVLGVAIFSTYHYLRLSKKTTAPTEENKVVSFNIGDTDHIWGKKDAKITMVVFGDFTCPYCREYFVTLEEFIKNRSDKMRIVWKHLPLSLQSVGSVSSATAAECAGEQNKFWEYATDLYKNQDKLSPEFYEEAAVGLGLDKDIFSACVSSGKYDAKIQADYNEAIIKGVDGAPASFLNGRYLPGALPLEQLEALIDPLLK
ncbi:thioredoxin domain-containing protein [Candidatus Kuenenbacteria bacterium]|nr:thioredoxin domain-containing protein [Candidatus Kuenenbacteria bacterium]